MLRAGAILLTLWMGFNLILSLGILFMLLVLGKNSPALLVLFGDLQGTGLDPRALTTINGLAVVANAAIAGLCIVSLVIIWRALARGAAWAFWALAAAWLLLQTSRWAGDTVLYHEKPLAGAAILLPVIAGLSCAAFGLFRKPR
jgi:hypothetical protein